MTLMTGCCGFPMARQRYFERFGLVEVQQTFYQPPQLHTLERRRGEAPDGFVFTLKAWQLITHEPSSPTYRRLQKPVPAGRENRYGSFRPTDEVYEAWRTTFAAARALAATVIVFQSPASFSPTWEHAANLAAFFRQARTDVNAILLGWEPRGEWPDEEVRELCSEAGAIHVVDPFATAPRGGDIRYFRLHGVGGYHYHYTDEDLARLHAWCGGRQTFCLFNNLAMAEDATRFQALTGVPA